jgi:cobalt-zinc-cadmium efflux system outer membrane protein
MELWQRLASTKEEVLAYQGQLLPSAQKAYSQAKDGFDRGAFSFLDLLDAQRTLFDVQEKYLAALASFHETKAQLDMLTGAYAQVAATVFNPNTDKKE